MKVFMPILCLYFMLLNGCTDDATMVPQNARGAVDSGSLSYSGVLVLGSSLVPWTGQAGILIFTVVRNHSDADWNGVPEAAVYSINSDASRGDLIAVNEGVITSHVDRDNLTPADELRRVRANDEREALTFVPVDFSAHPRVYVYWKFVDRHNETMAFKSSIVNPSAQHHLSFSEARALLKAAE